MDIQTGVILWLVALGAILVGLRTRGTLGVGLVLAYFLNLALIHLPGAMLYLNPEYAYYKRSWVELGFEQSTYSVLGLAVGALATSWLIHQMHPREIPAETNSKSQVVFSTWMHRFYVALGLLSYFVISPLANNVPTLSAVVSVMNQLLLLGICLGMWHAWQHQNWRALAFWILTLGALPVMTIVVQGFIGFGTIALLTGLSFLASFFRPRWLILLTGAAFLLFGVSAFITYFRDRDEIRHIVWGGEGLGERVGQVVETFVEFEWFDPGNERHLRSIDMRLNQNWLVGVAIEQLAEGEVEYKYGATIMDAAVAVIPRALWPDKPVGAGSGNMVSQATGIEFAQGTSIGVGQVLEFYYNFGVYGVIAGGLLWGIALSLLDTLASRALFSSNARRFTLFYLLGLGLIQPGGSLVEVAATTAAAVIASLIVNDFLIPFFVGAFQDEETGKGSPNEPNVPPVAPAPPRLGWE